MTVFFGNIFRQKATAFLAKIFRPGSTETFFDKEFVEKYYIKMLSNYNATTFFFAKKQHKFSTLYAKILRHSTKFLRFFGEICNIMSKKIVLYSVFWQDFSARFLANIRHYSTANDNIFCTEYQML